MDFAAIYERYFSQVYNYVRYRVRLPEAADDVTGRVFEAALSGFGTKNKACPGRAGGTRRRSPRRVNGVRAGPRDCPRSGARCWKRDLSGGSYRRAFWSV